MKLLYYAGDVCLGFSMFHQGLACAHGIYEPVVGRGFIVNNSSWGGVSTFTHNVKFERKSMKRMFREIGGRTYSIIRHGWRVPGSSGVLRSVWLDSKGEESPTRWAKNVPSRGRDART